MESAYSFLDNGGVKETHSFPELLFRYGLTERLRDSPAFGIGLEEWGARARSTFRAASGRATGIARGRSRGRRR